MAYVEKVGKYLFTAEDRPLTYVRKPRLFGFRWIPTSKDRATHVIHMWLPDNHSPYRFTAHERDW